MPPKGIASRQAAAHAHLGGRRTLPADARSNNKKISHPGKEREAREENEVREHRAARRLCRVWLRFRCQTRHKE
jgi:hypothetical protein